MIAFSNECDIIFMFYEGVVIVEIRYKSTFMVYSRTWLIVKNKTHI